MGGTVYSLSQWRAHGQDAAPPQAIRANPYYVNRIARDYRLCTGAGVPVASCADASPAINQGVDLLDLDGDGSTTDRITAGAFITGDERIGPNFDGGFDPGGSPPQSVNEARRTDVRN